VARSLGALDTTWGQVTADLLLVLLVAFNAYMGWRHGTLRRVLAFGGVYLGAFAATNIGNGLADLLHPHSLYANAWAFVGIFVLVIVTVEIIGQILHDKVQIAVVAFDRIAGSISGGIVGLAQAMILFLVALSMASVPADKNNTNVEPSRTAAAAAIKSATLSGLAVRAEPQLKAVFSPALPGDFTGHLGQSLKVVTPPT